MNHLRALIPTLALSAIALSLGACGQLAYKTGAGADALAADEVTCKQGAVAASVYGQCMHDRGWTIADLDGNSDQPVAAAVPTADPVGAPAVLSPTAPAVAGQGAPAAVPAAVAVAPVDPTAPVKVTTWIRFGGGGPSDDIAACVAMLGPAHQPDIANKTVTRALLSCMREKGWRGL